MKLAHFIEVKMSCDCVYQVCTTQKVQRAEVININSRRAAGHKSLCHCTVVWKKNLEQQLIIPEVRLLQHILQLRKASWTVLQYLQTRILSLSVNNRITSFDGVITICTILCFMHIGSVQVCYWVHLQSHMLFTAWFHQLHMVYFIIYLCLGIGCLGVIFYSKLMKLTNQQVLRDTYYIKTLKTHEHPFNTYCFMWAHCLVQVELKNVLSGGFHQIVLKCFFFNTVLWLEAFSLEAKRVILVSSAEVWTYYNFVINFCLWKWDLVSIC